MAFHTEGGGGGGLAYDYAVIMGAGSHMTPLPPLHPVQLGLDGLAARHHRGFPYTVSLISERKGGQRQFYSIIKGIVSRDLQGSQRT